MEEITVEIYIHFDSSNYYWSSCKEYDLKFRTEQPILVKMFLQNLAPRFV